MIEVELKYPVDSLAPVRDSLQQLETKLSHVSYQCDEYFDHPLRDFAKKDLALRIRCADKKCWLTFKGPKQDKSLTNPAKVRPEIEVELPDEDAAEKIKAILLGTGFCSTAVVRKNRETYELIDSEIPGQVEICLDEVSDLGCFVELEMLVDDDSGSLTATGAKQKLLEIAQSLELSNPITTSYLELITQL